MSDSASPWDFPAFIKTTEIFLYRHGYPKSSVRKFIRLIEALTTKLDRHSTQVVMILNKIEEAFALVSEIFKVFEILWLI